jgi:hypothetical protein
MRDPARCVLVLAALTAVFLLWVTIPTECHTDTGCGCVECLE